MSPLSAQVYLDTHRTVGAISPLLFGGFAEHMGRCIYEGIYDPASPHADEDGLRTDVMAALRELGYTVIRYPGGNFLSGYNWLDGVGPKEQRPRRRELAWFSIETNQFGTDEFMTFCRKVGAAPMLGVNLGTGTIDSAAALVEYCNAPTGTYYADLRAANGRAEPHNVKYWCLGNEMDGPWQIGHLDMHEYASKAREAAKLMRWHDPTIETVLCGSSNDRMATFPEWDRVALETCWEHVNYLSIHMYVSNHHDQDTPSYLALARRFEDFVDTMAATLRYVKAKNRSQHDVYLSWDEWQVWHPGETSGRWTEAPHLAEVGYNLEDALVVAQWLNVFLRKCDVVKVACMAQIVNIISWLHTTREGLLKHTSYYPFMLVSNHARGNSLDVLVKAPRYETKQFGAMPLLDVAASHDPETGKQSVFIVNRSQTESVATELVWQDAAPARVTAIHQIAGTDVKAENTFEQPERIVPAQLAGGPIVDHRYTLVLPPLSFTTVAAA
ncbi:MAG: Intracellular exo-alpha-(1-_5)-L-arabinofuranosidase [Chloroflexi bacterium ADurb.Bin325]|nr:MAG: Intracellular exo-alpha-(1->5)-L-arabinofuranosidase [Chloroflexi bacterium ADurb.Bin325]